MSAPVFILVTDSESLSDVAINLAAIEVVEAAMYDDGHTLISTAQHSVDVAMPVAEVFGLMQAALAGVPS